MLKRINQIKQYRSYRLLQERSKSLSAGSWSWTLDQQSERAEKNNLNKRTIKKFMFHKEDIHEKTHYSGIIWRQTVCYRRNKTSEFVFDDEKQMQVFFLSMMKDNTSFQQHIASVNVKSSIV